MWHPFTIFFFFWVCRRSTRVDASSTSNRHVFMLTLNSPSPTHGHWWLPVLWRSFWAPSLVSISQRLEVNDEAGQMQGGDVKAGELLPESGEEDGQLSRSWQWIWFYFVGEGRWRREADRSTVQDGGGGKHSPAALGFQVREKVGMEYWPSDKKLPCSDMQLVTWRAVVPWQEIITPPEKK